MAARTPTSILLLMDRRNRLEGELGKLTVPAFTARRAMIAAALGPV